MIELIDADAKHTKRRVNVMQQYLMFYDNFSLGIRQNISFLKRKNFLINKVQGPLDKKDGSKNGGTFSCAHEIFF